MNNPLENILRNQKQKQRTFGITENLLEKPVPRFYGCLLYTSDAADE